MVLHPQRALLLVLSFCLSAFWAPQGVAKKKKAPAAMQSQYDAAIDRQHPAIEQCVMQHGIFKGVQSVDINLKLLITDAGQVMGSTVEVQMKGGEPAKLKSCVETAMHSVRFPKSHHSLTEVHRNWKFARS